MINRFTFFLLAIAACILMPMQTFSQLAANKPKFVGNIIHDANNIRTANFKKYWNQVTAENDGKWGSVQGTNASTFGWAKLDNVYNFAIGNNFPYKHHTLIWGQQQPSFINTLDSAAQYAAIAKWIDTTAKRYPNTAMVDVVNEALPTHAPPDGQNGHANYKNALGGDGATGWDWVIKAFELARQSWPASTKLLINDYGILNSSSNTDAYIVIINLLKARNLIDGIGCQGHGFENASAGTIKSNLDKLAQTGLPIYITEFDLNIQDDNAQLTKFRELFPAMYEHPAVRGITLWGYVQYETWKDYTYLVTDRLAERPVLQWLRSYLVAPPPPVAISPRGTTEPRNTTFVWHSSDASTTVYHLQVASNTSFAMIALDTMVTDTVLQVDSLAANTPLYWHVSAINSNAESDYSSSTYFQTNNIITSVRNDQGIPQAFTLLQNYPNPFNPSTMISYDLPKSSYVKLQVFDMLGRIVATLVDGVRPASSQQVRFNAAGLSSGVYIYRIHARSQDGTSDFTSVKKLLLMK